MAVSDSRLAMYEGIIALGWADEKLDDNERRYIQQRIHENRELTDSQRSQLLATMDKKNTLEEVWPRITEMHDRLHLIDVAQTIFLQDGYCSDPEKLHYEALIKKHLDSLDMNGMRDDLKNFSKMLASKRDILNKNHKNDLRLRMVMALFGGVGWKFYS